VIIRIADRCGLFLVSLAAAGGLWASTPPADVDIVDYTIGVALDPGTHRLEGVETIRWTNRTDVATDELYFHLYLNAFAGSRTTFMRELERRSLRNRSESEGGWGWIEIERLIFDDGSDLLPEIEFVRPDDGNLNDFSLARVVLPRVVEPSPRRPVVSKARGLRGRKWLEQPPIPRHLGVLRRLRQLRSHRDHP
jgi:hypothetical protein